MTTMSTMSAKTSTVTRATTTTGRWILTMTTLMLTLVVDASVGIHECDSIFAKEKGRLVWDVFRCTTAKRLCLSTKDLICREPLLSTGIYVQCPDSSNQWSGLCDRICFAAGYRMTRGFKCGDGHCERDFMKWCDGKVDCPNDNEDEAHCNCTARPSDCQHWASSDSSRSRGLVSSQYLFRRVFAPMGFFVIILVIWKYYRTMKLRQRLASLHNHPDVRLCDADVVYVGGVTELARRQNNNNNNNRGGSSSSAGGCGEGGDFAGRGRGGLGGLGGLGPPPYSSTDMGPPPYNQTSCGREGEGGGGGGSGGGGPTEPVEPPSYQESVGEGFLSPSSTNRIVDASSTCSPSTHLRVALPPPLPSHLPLNNNNDEDTSHLPPPPPYESVAKKRDKDDDGDGGDNVNDNNNERR